MVRSRQNYLVFSPRPIDLAHYISLVVDGNVVEQVESTKF